MSSTKKLSLEVILAFGFGVTFFVALLVLAILFPEPTAFQYAVFRIILAIAAAGVAAVIPGILNVHTSFGVRAGGALAVFVIVYFFSPAGLTGVKVKTSQEIEMEKPVLTNSTILPELSVAKDDDLLNPEVLAKRYKLVRIQGIQAKILTGGTLVAEEIQGMGGAAIRGHSFTIVTKRLSNITLDVSAKPNDVDTKSTLSLFLYAKQVENVKLSARGLDGRAGVNGIDGERGVDGSDGVDGQCGPGMLGQFRGSTGGGDGRDGKNGSDGENGTAGTAGGQVALTTILEPQSISVDVSGGNGGNPGKGGHGGQGGKGGRGGSGCSGLGGNQPDRPSGRPGNPGAVGKDGQLGTDGAKGDYRLVILKTFDGIVKILNEQTSNSELHYLLQRP